MVILIMGMSYANALKGMEILLDFMQKAGLYKNKRILYVDSDLFGRDFYTWSDYLDLVKTKIGLELSKARCHYLFVHMDDDVLQMVAVLNDFDLVDSLALQSGLYYEYSRVTGENDCWNLMDSHVWRRVHLESYINVFGYLFNYFCKNFVPMRVSVKVLVADVIPSIMELNDEE